MKFWVTTNEERRHWRTSFPQIQHNGRRMVFFRSARGRQAGCGNEGCAVRSQMRRRERGGNGKKVGGTYIASRSSWMELMQRGAVMEGGRKGSERHPVTHSLTQRSFACMEVEEGHGKFHRVSAGWMGSQPQKLSLSAAARTGWT